MLKSFLCAATALIALPALAKPVAPTVEQMAAYPTMSGFNLSADGKHMVALEGRGEDRVILVWKTDNLAGQPTVIGSKQMKIQSAFFIKDDLLAVSLWQPYDFKGERVTKTFISKLFITDLEGKNWHEPLPLPRAKSDAEDRAQAATSPSILDSLPNDADHILVVNNVGVDSGDVYKVDLRDYRAERIQRSEDNVSGFQTDRSGNLRARIKANTDGKGAYVATELRAPGAPDWVEHFRSYVRDRDQVSIIGFTEDPNIALLSSNQGEDKQVIYEYNVATRTKGEVIFRHKFFEASGVSLFPYAKGGAAKLGEIMGIGYAGPRETEMTWINPTMQGLDKSIRAALNINPIPTRVVDPGTGASATIKYDHDISYRLIDYSSDLKSVVFAVDSVQAVPRFYLLKDGKLNMLSKMWSQIDEKALGRTSLVYYKARDGLDIPAFLTKPSEDLCGPGPWRAVVHPHGGPWARDDMNFDGSMWVPLMSSRCMAVLQPQFRGSDGWSRKLWKAGDAEWGQKMQDDKDDGAKWLIDNKIAIPGRMAMFGFSYGGYSAMAAAVRPNGLYKCAIAGAGVSDIKQIWARFFTNPFFRQAQAPTVKGLNPLDFADQIKIPIMVYQGERDRTVPPEQSEWFADKAKKSGQPVEFHMLKDYAHGPAWTRAIMAQQLRYIDDYFAKGCGGGGL